MVINLVPYIISYNKDIKDIYCITAYFASEIWFFKQNSKFLVIQNDGQ